MEVVLRDLESYILHLINKTCKRDNTQFDLKGNMDLGPISLELHSSKEKIKSILKPLLNEKDTNNCDEVCDLEESSWENSDDEDSDYSDDGDNNGDGDDDNGDGEIIVLSRKMNSEFVENYVFKYTEPMSTFLYGESSCFDTDYPAEVDTYENYNKYVSYWNKQVKNAAKLWINYSYDTYDFTDKKLKSFDVLNRQILKKPTIGYDDLAKFFLDEK